MTARGELATVVIQACGVGMEVTVRDAEEMADIILAAGYVRHRTITTIEEVDALPDMSAVKTCFGDAQTIYRNNHLLPPERFHSLVLYGPVTVLHEPEADTPKEKS